MVHTPVNSEASEKEAFINQIAETIDRWGLRLPAVFALDAGQPILMIGSQLLWLAQPVAALFSAADEIGQLAELLNEPDDITRLLGQLEAM